MKYRLDHIEALNAELANDPEENRGERYVTKQEAIKVMARNIELMLRDGKTFEYVVKRLAVREIHITAGTLRSYLRRLRRARKRPAKDPGAAANPARPRVAPAVASARHKQAAQQPGGNGQNAATTEKTAPRPRQPEALRKQQSSPAPEPSRATIEGSSHGTFVPRPDTEDI